MQNLYRIWSYYDEFYKMQQVTLQASLAFLCNLFNIASHHDNPIFGVYQTLIKLTSDNQYIAFDNP